MVDSAIFLVILAGIILVFGTAAYAGFKAAPWVPVFKRDIERILKLAAVGGQDVVYDLGSGDGRILVALANNTKARDIAGYEISVLPYLWTKVRLWFHGLSGRVEVRYANFLERDLGAATVIFCFLTPMAMKKLGPKFRRELHPGTRIISYSFSIPGWEPTRVDKPEPRSMTIYTYLVD